MALCNQCESDLAQNLQKLQSQYDSTFLKILAHSDIPEDIKSCFSNTINFPNRKVAKSFVSLHANCNISQLSQHQRAHIRLFNLDQLHVRLFNQDQLHANFFCLFNVYELREAKEAKANKNKNTSTSLEILFSK